MIFKSPVFSQASGSIAGIVYSRNAGGMYIRSRANPTNPNTPNQQVVRDAMRTLTDYWTNTMNVDEREDWNTYAFNTPTLNKLGEPTHKTGQQMFIRGNIPRLQAGLPIAVLAPTTFDLGSFSPISGASADAAGDDFTIPFTITLGVDDWAHEDDSAMLGYQSRPQNATRNFGKGPYQLLTTILGDATTPPVTPAAPISLFPLAPGQKVFLLVRVTRADGRLSGTQTIHCLT